MAEEYTDADKIEVFDKEDTGDSNLLCHRDSSKIRVDQRNVNLATLIGMIKGDQIHFKTEFQRATDLWTNKEKSRLIESVLLGLPLPSFFFCERPQEDYEWDVIDGLQRLCAFRDFFVEKSLALTNLEFLTDYNEKKYDDLSPKDQWKMDMLMLNLNIVTRQTPEDIKYIIFNRVNTGGYVLTQQEMRHALLQGAPAEYVCRLANSSAFRRATCPTVFTRMADRELVTRYLAFHSIPYKGDKELHEFLFEGMRNIRTWSEEEKAEQEFLFYESLECATEIFDGKPFRKPVFSEFNRLNPISKALFETVMVQLAKLTGEQRKLLCERKEKFNLVFREMYENSPTFGNDLTNSTARLAVIKRRWSEMANVIFNVIDS